MHIIPALEGLVYKKEYMDKDHEQDASGFIGLCIKDTIEQSFRHRI